MQPKRLPWFRLYASMVDDPDVRLLAYEDRWHFVALLCLKAQGVLDAGDHPDMLRRKVAVKLGLQLRELEAAADRIAEVGLIDAETFQPLDWNRQQFVSDTDPTAAQRKRNQRKAQRERKQEQEQEQLNQQLANGHGHVTRDCHVTGTETPVTVTRTETTTTKATATSKTTTTATVPLDWSAAGLKSFTEKDRVEVVRRLNGHSQDTQQDLLDELAGHIEDGVVKNSPFGLLGKLSAAAHAADFALNRGRRVRDERIAKASPKIVAPKPGKDLEPPYENAINFAKQTFGPGGNTPNKAEFERLMAEAATKWPEEATKSLAEASARGERRAR